MTIREIAEALARPEFKPGQRVRVRLNPEYLGYRCPQCGKNRACIALSRLGIQATGIVDGRSLPHFHTECPICDRPYVSDRMNCFDVILDDGGAYSFPYTWLEPIEEAEA